MERIVYRKTLDVHKNGVQFLLQGFETADNMSRVIEISLMASGDAIDFPLERLVAMMYVTTPGATEPSINKCTIKDNKIIYDVLPIVEEGITTMQLKLIDSRTNGATGVLASPKFAVEVTKSGTNDESAEQSTTFTALEDAMAKAKTVYDERFLRMELDSDCIFKAYYADGTYYETDVLQKLFLNGNVLLSESYAHGGTGVRAGEDTDNSMYYSIVSRSEALTAKSIMEDSEDILEEVRLHGVYTAFSVDFETGEVEYVSPSFKFKIDTETGELDAEGQEYTFDNEVGRIVAEWLEKNGVILSDLQAISTTHTDEIKELQDRITPIEKGGTGADNAYDARTNLDVFSKRATASENTLGLFGLSADNSPNTILSMLGSHWWRRRTVESGYALSNEGITEHRFVINTLSSRIIIYYADSVVASEGGFSLVNPTLKQIDFSNSLYFGETVEVEGLQGKYFVDSAMVNADGLYHFVYKSDDEPVTFEYNPIDNSSARGLPWNTNQYVSKYYEINGEWEYLYSINEEEYPTGTDGMFAYEYLGVPFENARISAKNTEDILNTLAGGES